MRPHQSGTRDWAVFFGPYLQDDTVLPALVQHWSYHQPLYERLRRLTPQGGRVLDVGCGVGSSVIYLSGLGYRVQGVDRNETLVLRAMELSARWAPGAHMSIGDAHALPYTSESFDVSISLGVLEHFNDDEFIAALQEQRRIAAIVFVVLPTSFTKFSAAGLTDERIFTRSQLASLC